MKSKILKSVQLSVIAASMLTSCLVLSNAYADDVYLGWARPDKFKEDIAHSSGRWLFNSSSTALNPFEKYGNIGHLEGSYRVLHGALDHPKRGAFTINIIPKGKSDEEELIFNSKEKASGLCADLIGDMIIPGISYYGISEPYWINSVTTIGGGASIYSGLQRVIEVPYIIAYDTASQQAVDGTSTPAIKYVMCPNYFDGNEWKLDPSINSENEETGILSSKLNDAKTEYTVTCMPAVAMTKPPITLTRQFTANGVVTWSDGTHPGTFHVNEANLTNLHQFNKYLGAQYCPVSPE